eukprot:CAMPEP_0168384050 /NCGR_PEP_ID=MMETSP0228-20121227/14214_1 /TAXON_ID=133427 /ORGANISM="Protoceratium reticulatum, Strain CCCM 535 (=CCMP 1889)" /LENGTH=108 /DNA_ID=CAMNT_0008397211 /DNA_START=285 /DNA_END=608 /DNA_ORIENTATION=+
MEAARPPCGCERAATGAAAHHSSLYQPDPPRAETSPMTSPNNHSLGPSAAFPLLSAATGRTALTAAMRPGLSTAAVSSPPEGPSGTWPRGAGGGPRGSGLPARAKRSF